MAARPSPNSNSPSLLLLVGMSLWKVAGLAGYTVRTFLLFHLLFDVGVGTSLASVCYVVAANGSWLRGGMAGLIGFVAAVVLGVTLGTKLSVFFTISRAVRQVGLGSMVLEALFNNLLGCTAEQPEGSVELTRKLHGVTRDEAERVLNESAEAMLGDQQAAGIAGFTRWIARKVVWVVVRAIVRLILMRSAAGKGSEAQIDLIAVRDQLADDVDQQLVEHLRRRLIQLAFGLATGVVVVAILLAYWIRQIPVG